MLSKSSYNLGRIIFVTICLHIPNNLVTEKLRYFGSFEYEPGDITCGHTSIAVDTAPRGLEAYLNHRSGGLEPLGEQRKR